MKFTRIAAAALVAGVLVASATACSSDEAKALPKAEWVKQANAICTAGSKETEKLAKDLNATGGKPSQKAMNDYIQAAASNSVAEIGKIKKLGYPKGDAEKLDGALVVWEKALAEMAKGPDNAAELSADAKVTAATATLKKYGITKCAGS